MKTFNQMQRDFNKKVKELQKKCPHKSITDWAEIWWAPGHGTGTSCRMCKKCRVRVYYSHGCKICNNCGKKNSMYMGSCMKCKSEDMTEYSVIEKLGKIIEKTEVKRDKEGFIIENAKEKNKSLRNK